MNGGGSTMRLYETPFLLEWRGGPSLRGDKTSVSKEKAGGRSAFAVSCHKLTLHARAPRLRNAHQRSVDTAEPVLREFGIVVGTVGSESCNSDDASQQKCGVATSCSGARIAFKRRPLGTTSIATSEIWE